MKDKLLEWLNLALMANLFLVLFSFFWLAIAALGRALGIPLGLDLWYKLWEPVFTPAIGILMAGAILSGIIGWINKQLASAKTNI
ncbi:MAG: hypothetical protein HC769_01035 [Cyanobacteria bacterium CRU_2_1]|nr:hypothetical protein [Cyanobacteria bacterium RU_5_0]NJR57553.1 hypothetical protein [Cyanobacteria bacterium CRU_2_1]